MEPVVGEDVCEELASCRAVEAEEVHVGVFHPEELWEELCVLGFEEVVVWGFGG